MKFPEFAKVYGDQNFRGECVKEDNELSTFFNQLRKHYPETLGIIALHPKNEGKRSVNQARVDRMKGAAVGACDIIIAGCPTLLIEMKRKDHTQSTWQPKQIPFMQAAHDNGAMVCVCLGWEAAFEALKDWMEINKKVIDNSQLF